MYNLVVEDYDRYVYEKELKDFLPKDVFDFHIHVFRDDTPLMKDLKMHPNHGLAKLQMN